MNSRALSTHVKFLHTPQSKGLRKQVNGSKQPSIVIFGIHTYETFVWSQQNVQNTTHGLPSSFSPYKFVGSRHLPYKGNHISAQRFHYGDCQISFKKETNQIQYGKVVEIVFFKSIRIHYLLVSEYPTVRGPKHRSTYGNDPMLQAEIVYKEGVIQLFIEGNMVTGHLASFVHPFGSFGSERKMLFVVSLHYSVSLFVSLSKWVFFGFFSK